MADQTGIDLKPYKKERFIGGRQKVKLYYINPDYHRAHKGIPPQQTVKNMAYTMPELGEFIIIDEVFASDILSKTGFKGKPIFILESEGGAEVASLIKQAMEDGTPFEELDLGKVAVTRQLAQLDDDELKALMEQRGFKVQRETTGSTVNLEKNDPKKDPKEGPKEDPKSTKKDTKDGKDGK